MKTVKNILKSARLWLLSGILCGSMQLHAQGNNVAQLNAFDYDQTEMIYRFHPVVLNINVPHDKGTNVDVSCTGCGEFKKSDSGEMQYSLMGATERTAEILIKAVHKGKTSEIRRSYKVMNLPLAQAFLDGIMSGGKIKRVGKGLLEVKFPPEIKAPATYEVTSWQMGINEQDLSGTGNQLSPDALRALATVIPGDQIKIVLRYKSFDGIYRETTLQLQVE